MELTPWLPPPAVNDNILRPQQHSWTDHDTAALLIRKATITPDINLPLLKKDPYTCH